MALCRVCRRNLGQRTDADLLAEFRALREQLKALRKKKIDLVSQAGGADQIQARIGRITGILADRRVEIPH